MMTDRVGQQLGNYRLVCLLGRGGFAEVYLGEHLHLKSYAALKVLRTALSDEDVATFLTEGQQGFSVYPTVPKEGEKKPFLAIIVKL